MEKTLEETVDNLYRFRDNYFKDHPPISEEKKMEDLSLQLKNTLKLIDDKKGNLVDSDSDIEYKLLRAKALNIFPNFNEEAFNILTKMVKFHPKRYDAWNELGECFVKKNDMKAAKSCFENALKEKKNAISLQNLSMVLRQLGDTPEERMINIHLSVEKAKEALNLDIQNGKSWYILGNAYLSLFFTTNQNPNMLKQALLGYNNAIADEILCHNPDVYYNRAVALMYDERYQLALENFENAIKYDPFWSSPKEQLETLIKHLENIQLMVDKKGKLKQRKIRELINSLKSENNKENATSIPKENVDDLEKIKFSELIYGSNDGKKIQGKVVCQVYSDNSPFFTFCMIDEEEMCIAVNVYNMAKGKGVIIGDSITIPKPYLHRFDFTFKNKAFKFSCIRVNNPLQMLVNQKKLQPSAQATPSLQISLQS